MPVAPQDKPWDWKPDNKGVAFVVFFVQWHIYSVSVNILFVIQYLNMPVWLQDEPWPWKPDNKGVALVCFFIQCHV